MRIFNTVFEQCVDERGFGLLYTEKEGDHIVNDKVSYDLKNIEVFEKLPEVEIEVQNEVDEMGNIVFEKSQKLEFLLALKNISELPVT